MRNIQVIEGAANATYDIFAATDEEFGIIFPPGQNVAFFSEVVAQLDQETLGSLFPSLWQRRVPKAEVQGIHGMLFVELDGKKIYYPTRVDEQARNPDGTPARMHG